MALERLQPVPPKKLNSEVYSKRRWMVSSTSTTLMKLILSTGLEMVNALAGLVTDS
jgi:hypothetical protein